MQCVSNFKSACQLPLLVALLCIVFGTAPRALAGQGRAHVPLPVELEGSLDGAEYKIRVPENWNGTLLVFAHGRGATEAQLVPPRDPSLEGTLLSLGYALAGSSFKNAGFAVKEGVHDTLALTGFFRGHIGNPDRIIVWGNSMGGLITAASIEKYPGIYDAGIPTCGSVAGTPHQADSVLAFGLAYAVAFGWPASWGSLEDIRDDLTWAGVWPILSGQLPTNPQNFARSEFVRLVNSIPLDLFYASPAGPGFMLNMWAATEVRAEMEARAGGPMGQNLDHVYSLSPADEAYVDGLLSAAGLGVSASSLLAQMDGWRIPARPSARNYVEQHGGLAGNIKRPVLSIHTTIDPLLPVSEEYVYRETIHAAGQEDMLVQAYTDTPGHCAFIHDQLLAAVEAMMSWLDAGEPPGPEFFPDTIGFVPGFVPPPPPF